MIKKFRLYKKEFMIERKKIEEWHKYFAWRPIQIGKNKIWLERVYRRGKAQGHLEVLLFKTVDEEGWVHNGVIDKKIS